ncbi:unnamed protein product [Pylaiella littoralis]
MPTCLGSATSLRARILFGSGKRRCKWSLSQSIAESGQSIFKKMVAPHPLRAICARRLAAGATRAPPPPPRDPSRHGCPRNEVPGEKDLPMILTAAGMVKLCNLPGNRGLPLVGLDVAPSNFGVAISDQTRTFAVPLTRVPRRESARKLDPSIVLGKLREIIEEHSACGLVVGWPLSKSGRAEGQCLMVLQFLRQLHLKGKVFIPVTLCDERLTSVEARGILKGDGRGRKTAELEDETAAMVILQGFLDSIEADRGGLSTLPTRPGRGDDR